LGVVTVRRGIINERHQVQLRRCQRWDLGVRAAVHVEHHAR
jgi:hypothetical protein